MTQKVRDAGFKITTKIMTDYMGICHLVIIERDKKRTQRRGRKYNDALQLCAEARGLS